jgi:hypothetical protein
LSFLIYFWLQAVQTVGDETNNRSQLFAQVQFVDQFLITIGFCFAQIIKQTPALRDHLKEAAAGRVIFPIGLKMLSQMLDPASQKCDLHIRAAGIFVMQLKLLETQRFTALCHNEGPILDEEPILATDALQSDRAAVFVDS